MAEVRFEHVFKRYAQSSAFVIQDMNLAVRDHEFLVLVGPSGCGKSTALRMIAGLEEISEGDLYIGERRVNDVAPKDRDIAMVFQNYALYPHMSVYDNMAFSLKLRHMGRKEIEQRVQQAARMLGIGEYLARKPRALSGGQRQRVALGRALVRNPKVFLLDEPLSNLDAKLRGQTRTEIARLHQQTQTTFVYVTHDQVEAMTMGDRIAVLSAGIIQQLGTPQELYDNPANLFVAGFIGSPAMAFFEGRLVRQSEGQGEGGGAGGEGAALLIGSGAEARTLTLAGTAADYLAGQATAGEGRPVTVGIRPEDLRPTAEGAPNSLVGEVDVVEHLGNEQLVYLRVPGTIASTSAETAGAVTARIPPSTPVRPGERMTLRVEVGRLHVFDPATTKRFI